MEALSLQKSGAPLLSMEVALSSWPEITLEVSEHFYVIFWIVVLLSVILLLNLVIMTTGVIIVAALKMYKDFKEKKNLPKRLKEEENNFQNVSLENINENQNSS